MATIEKIRFAKKGRTTEEARAILDGLLTKKQQDKIIDSYIQPRYTTEVFDWNTCVSQGYSRAGYLSRSVSYLVINDIWLLRRRRKEENWNWIYTAIPRAITSDVQQVISIADKHGFWSRSDCDIIDAVALLMCDQATVVLKQEEERRKVREKEILEQMKKKEASEKNFSKSYSIPAWSSSYSTSTGSSAYDPFDSAS